MKKFTKLLVSGLCLTTLAHAGCSSSGSTGNENKENTENTETGSEPQVIKIGAMATQKPFIYTDEDDNIIGFDIDMMNAIDERLEDYTFEYQDLQFSALFVSLQTGDVDMLTGGIARTPEREAEYIVPSINSGSEDSSLVVPEADTETHNFEQMGGKSIPMDPSRFEYGEMAAWNEAHPDQAMEIIEMSDVTQAESMKMVADGRADAALVYRTSFDEIQNELNLPVRMDDSVATRQYFCQLINNDRTEFAAAYEEALQSVIDDGTLSELSIKWLGYDMFAE